MRNTKYIVGRVLSDLVPGTGLIAQNGAEWRFTRPVQGLEGRTFNSQEEAIELLTDHYVRIFDTETPRNVAGIGPGIVDPQAMPNRAPGLTPQTGQPSQQQPHQTGLQPNKRAV